MAKDPRLNDNPASVNEAIQDRIIRHSVYLERLKGGEANKILKILDEEILPDIANQIQRRLEEGSSTSRLERLESGLRGIVNRSTQKLANEITDTIGDLSKAELQWFVGMVRKELGFVLEFTIPSAGTIVAATLDQPFVGFPLQKWFENLSSSTQRNLIQAIRQGAIEGQTVQQIMQRVRGTRANNFTDGVLSATKRQAEAITRTAIQHITNNARNELYKQNKDIIKGIKWVATLDSRTSPQCFPENVIVQSGSFLKDVFKAEYSGEFITIKTATGEEVEGTANHPVLTPKGFLPFNKIKEGDQIFTAIIGDKPMAYDDQNISMPAIIGELFDYVAQRPNADVVRQLSTIRDFYDDGEGISGDISIASINSDLYTGDVYGINDAIIKELLRFTKFVKSLNIGSGPDFCFMEQWFSNVPAQINVSFIQSSINSDLRASNLSGDFQWFYPLVKHINHAESISFDVFITLAALQMWHDPKSFQKRCDSSGKCRISSPNPTGRNSLSVKIDNVVSVGSNFKSCYVYTMSDNVECYTANGILVKNCRTLDSKVFPLDKGPRPPIHVNCRSTTTPVLRSARSLGLNEIPESTRASMDGQVPADTTYNEWLKRQPSNIQDDILGKTRGKLFRDGGLPVAAFTNRNLRPLTLKELQKKETKAFEKAGISI